MATTRVRRHRRRTQSGVTTVVKHDRSIKGHSVSDIGRAFWAGQSRSGGGGKQANVTSKFYKDGSGILYEYGWAVLAEKKPSGKVIIYDGWYGYSPTTSKHFSQLGLNATGANIVHSKEAKQLSDMKRGVDEPKRQSEGTTFRISDTEKIVGRTTGTSTGFSHVVTYYRNGKALNSASVRYINRTWESFTYQTAISNLLDKMKFSKEKKKRIMDICSGKAHERLESQFQSTAMVASLGDVFGKTKKEKNEWKIRMIKAGLGQGFQLPDDWDNLSEDEKGRRLDKIIKYMKKKE